MNNTQIINNPWIFERVEIVKLEKRHNAKWVVDVEYDKRILSVFYQHETTKERPDPYIGFTVGRTEPITFTIATKPAPTKRTVKMHNLPFIEEMEIIGVEADNTDIIFSKARNDRAISLDNSVWIEGGPTNNTSSKYPNVPLVDIRIKNGSLIIE